MPELFDYRINFLGCPSKPEVPWTRENLQFLVDRGFNAIQLSVAWGCRPGDEPLNLEDVVDMSSLQPGQSLPLQSAGDEAAIARRRSDLRQRIALCREMGLRTIFHFGAPYNMHARFGDTPPNCLGDESVRRLYVRLIELFHEQFPGVDDLLVYTYDQDAWLCSEFGDCPRCTGVPLHERVSEFVNLLGRSWHSLNPDGRLWWEPWELSAGQALMSVERLDVACIGLSLHCTIAEVMSALPVDRWLKNTVAAARRRHLPVVVEHFLGAPTEEVEPLTKLCWPGEIISGLRAIAELAPDGIKEYYGCIPDANDVNLQATAAFLAAPHLGREEILADMAEACGAYRDEMLALWQAADRAMALFPWDASWWIREIGKADVQHAMTGAFIRGQQAHTPSWESNRRCMFMFTDNGRPDAWALEDIQLRCRLASEQLARAAERAGSLAGRIGGDRGAYLAEQAKEFDAWRRRAVAYACHLRETNLCEILRRQIAGGAEPAGRVVAELREVLSEDLANQDGQGPCAEALEALDADLATFLNNYFVIGDEDGRSRGEFSVTSR